jgi:MFS family permease
MVALNANQRFAYLGSSFSLGIFNAFNNYTLSLWLHGLNVPLVLISFLGNSKSVEGTVVSPLAGMWSDRIWLGKLGRRRPFILVGGVASGLLFAVTPLAARLPVPEGFPLLPEDLTRILPIVAVIFLFTLAYNLGDDIHKALRADLVDGAELNSLSGLATVVEIATQVVFLGFVALFWTNSVPDVLFVIAGGLVVAGVLVTVIGVREPAPEVWKERTAVTEAEEAGRISKLAFLKAYRGAVMFCVVSLFYWSGVNAVLPLVSIYVQDELHTTTGEAQFLPALLLLSTGLMAYPAAQLASRFGKRPVLAIGYAIMAVCAVVGLLITTKEQGIALFLVAGIGNSATVLHIPMMADLVPRQHMGVGTGMLAAAGSVAAPAASLVGGSLSEIYGPRVIFAVMAVMVVAAIAVLPTVTAPPELAAPLPDRSPAKPEPVEASAVAPRLRSSAD